MKKRLFTITAILFTLTAVSCKKKCYQCKTLITAPNTPQSKIEKEFCGTAKEKDAYEKENTYVTQTTSHGQSIRSSVSTHCY